LRLYNQAMGAAIGSLRIQLHYFHILKRTKHNNIIHSIEQFRSEKSLQFFHYNFTRDFIAAYVVSSISFLGREPNSPPSIRN
jgi:hypothetical protein